MSYFPVLLIACICFTNYMQFLIMQCQYLNKLPNYGNSTHGCNLQENLVIVHLV